MAKDPAFLFYPADFYTGTMTMSRHLKGCYIDLLIAQFNSGSLSLEEIKTVLGNDFAAWGSLSKKFEADEAGKFFNVKLRTEILKRKAFIDKQKVNGSKGGRPKENPSLNPKHKPDETNKGNGIENENLIENEVRGMQGGKLPPSPAMIEDAFVSNGLTSEQAKEFYLEVEGRQGWQNIHNWKVYTESAIAKRINQKNGTATGNNSNRYSAQKQSVADVKRLAIEVLRQSGGENSGASD